MNIDAYIAQLGSMTTGERHRFIETEPLPVNVGALLDQAAAEVPERHAWNFFEGGGTITYRELQRSVNRMANALRHWGVGQGTHVAAMLPNIPTMPTIWLALARLGAVMVPVNVRYTARELRYVVDDARVEFLIVHAEHRALLGPPGGGDAGARLDPERIALFESADPAPYRSLEALLEGRSDELEVGRDVTQDDLLNIQYTSGTTGFPKGCMLTQRYWLTSGKVNGLRDGKRFERILAATPFFYLDPQWLLLVAFYQRGTLYVAYRQSASRFAGWLRDHRIHFCLFPEAVYKQPPHPDDAKTVLARANIYGVRKEIHEDLRRRFNVPAMEAFGMTEVGPCLYVPLDRTEMIGSGSCGIPAPLRECRIVDETGSDVPVGQTGELVVRGPGIMSGYFRKPEANRDSYFGEWFRTGDLFRKDDRGFHYIVGRLKDMVRRSSENIAAREVEAVLRGLPEVLEAAIVAVPDDIRGEEVKAYIVLQPEARERGVPVETIFAHCQASLAAFKIPRYVEFIDGLPKTPSEKIAKGVLLKSKPDLRLGSYDRVEGRWR
ncbi:MAG: AMP-binding protein [Burkholderiales bacterium]|nr:AMP-binding protein [Burkholderiales bacterium]MCE7876130.1 AMP-binding protein [Betaproteobacteria bacterium PRO3]